MNDDIDRPERVESLEAVRWPDEEADSSSLVSFSVVGEGEGEGVGGGARLASARRRFGALDGAGTHSFGSKVNLPMPRAHVLLDDADDGRRDG